MGAPDTDPRSDLSGDAGHDTIPDMSRPHACRCEPVATGDIAARLGISVDTVQKWAQRELMPTARWKSGKTSLWCWEQDIVPWLQAHPRRRQLLDGTE